MTSATGTCRWLCLMLILCSPGCGYTVNKSFDQEIRSVHVPIFQSESDRRGWEFPLTEAVHKEIQLRTPFRLVSEPTADTQLIGRIKNVRKRVLGETRNDDPRELQMSLTVGVRWENLHTGETIAERDLALTGQEIQLIQRAEFAPEIGQSLASAQQQLVDRLARDIVDMMKRPGLMGTR